MVTTVFIPLESEVDAVQTNYQSSQNSVSDKVEPPSLNQNPPGDAEIESASDKTSEIPASKEDTQVESLDRESWHMEILLSLFMRADEQELHNLAKRSGIHSSILAPSVAPNSADDAKSQPNKSGRKRARFEQSHEPSQLPILSHIFEEIGTSGDHSLFSREDIANYFPSKYRRSNYASRDATSLSNHVMAAFIKQTPSIGQSSKSKHQFKPLTLRYNECSINTFSSWAFKKDAKPKGVLPKQKINFYYQPAAGTTFRQCNTCKNFGHFEVECEELARSKINNGAVKRGLQVEDKVAKEISIHKSLKEFITAEQIDQDYNSYTRLKERRFISYPWIDITNAKRHDQEKATGVKENTSIDEHLAPSTTGIIDDMNIVTNADSRDRSQHSVNDDEELFSERCEVCETNFKTQDILLCDGCDKMFHQHCLDPPLEYVPEGDWFCDTCKAYDSDVSSVTVIEGLDDFVIEQRKLSSFEKEALQREVDSRVGFRNNPWSSALTIAPENAEEIEVYGCDSDEDSSNSAHPLDYPLHNLSNNGAEDPIYDTISDLTSGNSPFLSIGELCWAKRRGTHTSSKLALGKDFYWPGMVVHVHDNSIAFDGVVQTPYIVKFFHLSAGGRIRASHILPFFPFYEELGVQRIESNRDNSKTWWHDFYNGVLEAVNQAGFVTLEEAHAYVQEGGIEIDKPTAPRKEQNTPTARPEVSIRKSLKDLRNKNPREWHRAEASEIDGITILSKPAHLDDDIDIGDQSLINTDDCYDDFNSELLTSEIWGSDEIKLTLEDLVLETKNALPIEELLGGLVAYSAKQLDNKRDEESVSIGVVAGFNLPFGKVLVRYLRNIKEFLQDANFGNESPIQAEADPISFSLNVGACEWIPLNEAVHLTKGPSEGNTMFCKSLVNLTLEKTREQLQKYCSLVAHDEELLMTELSSESEGESSSLDRAIFEEVVGELEDAKTTSPLSADPEPSTAAQSKPPISTDVDVPSVISHTNETCNGQKKEMKTESVEQAAIEIAPQPQAPKVTTDRNCEGEEKEGTIMLSNEVVSPVDIEETMSQRNMEHKGKEFLETSQVKLLPLTKPMILDVSKASEALVTKMVLTVTIAPNSTIPPIVTQELVSTKIPAATNGPVSTKVPASAKEVVVTKVPASTEELVAKVPASTMEPPVDTKVPASTEEPPVVTKVSASTKEPPVVTKVPASTKEVVVTKAPASTKAVVVTKVPSSTKEPPVVTKRAASTKEVVVTKVAASTKEVVVTKVPASAKELVVTKVPASTKESPVVTKVPASTKEVVVTKVLASTKEPPVVTKVAASTKELVVTKVPASTKELPIVTKVAASTKALPIVTKAPASTKEPTAAKESVAAKVPAATQETVVSKFPTVAKVLAATMVPATTKEPIASELSTDIEKTIIIDDKKKSKAGKKQSKVTATSELAVAESNTRKKQPKAISNPKNKRDKKIGKLLTKSNDSKTSKQDCGDGVHCGTPTPPTTSDTIGRITTATKDGSTSPIPLKIKLKVPKKSFTQSPPSSLRNSNVAPNPLAPAADTSTDVATAAITNASSIPVAVPSTPAAAAAAATGSTNDADADALESYVSPTKKGEDDEEGEIFQAERILSDRNRSGKREYLIKWKGFTDEHNTWENERNILDPQFLKKYLCKKHIKILLHTPDGKIPTSATGRAIKALRYGFENADEDQTKSQHSRTCPFCLKLVTVKKFGGHVRSHMDQPNYSCLKDISRFAKLEWFENST